MNLASSQNVQNAHVTKLFASKYMHKKYLKNNNIRNFT